MKFSKSHKKLGFHLLFRRCIFGKTRRGGQIEQSKMTGLVYLKVAVGVGMVLYQKLHEKSKSTGRPIGRNWH